MRHPLLGLVMISAGLAATLAIAVISPRGAEVQQIKPEELRKLIENNDPNILVVDTQPKGVHDLGHIKGAVNFPWVMDIRSPGDLPRDKMLILYCDCGPEEDSIDLSEQLTSKFGSSVKPPGGLRSVLANHERDALEIEVDDGGILIDLDTPQDYRRIL